MDRGVDYDVRVARVLPVLRGSARRRDRASPGSWAQHAVTSGAGALYLPESGDDAPARSSSPPRPSKTSRRRRPPRRAGFSSKPPRSPTPPRRGKSYENVRGYMTRPRASPGVGEPSGGPAPTRRELLPRAPIKDSPASIRAGRRCPSRPRATDGRDLRGCRRRRPPRRRRGRSTTAVLELLPRARAFATPGPARPRRAGRRRRPIALLAHRLREEEERADDREDLPDDAHRHRGDAAGILHYSRIVAHGEVEGRVPRRE